MDPLSEEIAVWKRDGCYVTLGTIIRQTRVRWNAMVLLIPISFGITKYKLIQDYTL